jgi:putative ABC transport system permease protein
MRLLQTLKGRIWESDRTQPFYAVTTMDQLVNNSLKERRLILILLVAFAVLSLVLAAVGIYGVMSFTTRQRTREIGVRVALGAQTRDIIRLIVGQGMTLTLLGVSVGLGASFAVTRLLSTLLFNIAATDFVTFIGISVLFGGVSLLACYLPARRAMKVDPVTALRCE